MSSRATAVRRPVKPTEKGPAGGRSLLCAAFRGLPEGGDQPVTLNVVVPVRRQRVVLA